MSAQRKPFDWEGFVSFLEAFSPLFLKLLRLFIGLKNLKAKIEQYETHVAQIEAAFAEIEQREKKQ